MDVGDARALDGVVVDLGIGYAEGDVTGDGVVAQVDVLRHIAEAVLPGAQIGIGQRDAVDPNDTDLGAEEAEDDVDQRRLSRAGRADDADRGFCLDRQGDVSQRRLVSARIDKGDAIELEPAGEREDLDMAAVGATPDGLVFARRAGAASVSSRWTFSTAGAPNFNLV